MSISSKPDSWRTKAKDSASTFAGNRQYLSSRKRLKIKCRCFYSTLKPQAKHPRAAVDWAYFVYVACCLYRAGGQRLRLCAMCSLAHGFVRTHGGGTSGVTFSVQWPKYMYMHTYTNALAHGRIHVNTQRRQWLIALIFGGCVEYWLKFEFTKVRHGDIITCTLCGKALCSVANRHRSLVTFFSYSATFFDRALW